MQRIDRRLPQRAQDRNLGKRSEGIENYRLAVTEQPQGCQVYYREHSQHYCNSYVWCQVGADNITGTTL